MSFPRVLFLPIIATAMAHVVAAQTPDCSQWQTCRALALDAAERGDYERFHDLAWRAVQTGRPRDQELMFLLARAQALRGRPHDALVMLDRLADLGAEVDASGHEFERVRQLPQWPALAEKLLLRRAAASAPATAAAGAPLAVASPSRPVLSLSTMVLAPAGAPFRAPIPPSGLRGLIYDAVSARYVIAPGAQRKLQIVAEGSGRTSDFVRADLAGFLDITAVEIDRQRGDLWVASTDGAASVVNRLQLLSGHTLRAFNAGDSVRPTRFVDLALTGGTVYVLDAAGPRIWAIRGAGTGLEPVMPLSVTAPSSIAARADGTLFVSYRGGIVRIDPVARRTAPLSLPGDVIVERLERIRWSNGHLLVVQRNDDDSSHVVRLELGARGGVERATRIEVPEAGHGPAIWLSTEELIYLTPPDGETLPAAQVNVTLRRVPLR